MPPDTITIIDHSDRIEEILDTFKTDIGDDFAAYRGHVYRVLTYASHFLGGETEHRDVIDTALAYHDIALWSDDELAYLEPSEQRAVAANARHAWGLDDRLLVDIIHWHHKVRPWSGPDERIVNACRKADWIDASGGKLRKGLSKAQVSEVETAIPNHDFGNVLQRLAKDLGGNAVTGNLKVLRRVFKL